MGGILKSSSATAPIGILKGTIIKSQQTTDLLRMRDARRKDTDSMTSVRALKEPRFTKLLRKME